MCHQQRRGMKLLSAERIIKYNEYQVTSRLDDERVHEFIDLLLEEGMLFKISGSANKTISIPARTVAMWGEQFNVIVSGDMIHIEHLPNLNT